MSLDPRDLYHVAWVVPDLESAMDDFSSVGLRWATPVTRHIVTKTPQSERQAWSIDVTYSIDDPFHVELIEDCPGSPWQLDSSGVPHHMGWWAHDLRRDIKQLETEGYRLDAWMVDEDDEPTRFAYLQSPAGMRVELVDIAARPQLQAWWSGLPYP
ncbi:MAG: hypothetical protein RL218_160 [Actinomycetota bacterium]|jgi:hypothetical protein